MFIIHWSYFWAINCYSFINSYNCSNVKAKKIQKTLRNNICLELLTIFLESLPESALVFQA